MKYFIICLTICISLFAVKANAQGKITGKISDATTKSPVDYASIGVYKQGGTAPVNGTTSDPKGNFTIKGLPFGEYKITVDFLGYQRSTTEHILLGPNTPTVTLNNLTLAPAQKVLKDVNITSAVSTVENKIDKLVYNVGNDLTAQGGVATDVLKKVPMVSVDIDGNVELLGSTSVKFLINGKPSSIFGASLTDALQSIPSSQIKSIEVVTSPGAKYDASGTGGIINIILKDNKVRGYNGSINLSAGTRLENGSLNLNARQANFGVNAFFSGNQTLHSNTLGLKDRQDTTSTNYLHQLQNSNGSTERNGFQTGLGFDWNITKTDNISASGRFHHSSNHNEGLTLQEDRTLNLNNTLASDIFSNRNSTSQSGEDAIDIDVAYKKTFKKEGQELSIGYTSSYGQDHSDYYQKSTYVGNAKPASGSNGKNTGTDKETEITVDYAHPVTEDFNIETGAKVYLENVTSTATVNTYNPDPAVNDFVYDPLQSIPYNYGRDVYSYYLSASFPLFDFFDVKAGLRDEYTITTVDAKSAGIPDYNFLSPSFVLQHKLSKTTSLKLAYSKRIERPDFGDLNPFINYSDPYNISYGNPNLHPEIGNNFELGFNHSYDKGGNINVTSFYRHNGFDVKQYTLPRYDSLQEAGGKFYKNVYATTRANVGSEVTIGVNLSASLPLTRNFTIRPNLMLNQRRVMDNLPNVPSFVMGYEYRLNMNATYQFNNDLAAEAFMNYNGPRVGLQGKNSNFIAYNFAIRKLLWDKKGSLGFTTTVPFNQYVDQTSTIVQPGSSQYSQRQVPFRSFGISFSYKFGKLEFKKEDNKNADPGLPQPDKI